MKSLSHARGARPRSIVWRAGRGTGLAPVLLSISVSFAAAAASPLGAEESEEEDRFRFHVSVDMVGLSVTVLDGQGRLVGDLEEESFTVYEDGVKQEIEIFSREDLPLRMAILLDTSASMAPRMGMAQDAAIRLVRSLKAEDLVSVVEFNERVVTLEQFTSAFDDVEGIVRAPPRRRHEPSAP